MRKPVALAQRANQKDAIRRLCSGHALEQPCPGLAEAGTLRASLRPASESSRNVGLFQVFSQGLLHVSMYTTNGFQLLEGKSSDVLLAV